MGDICLLKAKSFQELGLLPLFQREYYSWDFGSDRESCHFLRDKSDFVRHWRGIFLTRMNKGMINITLI
jgi:hypothetical protein